MTGSEQAVQVRAADRPARRAGTFTFGIVLVCGGTAMLVSLFWPELPMEWALRLTPGILIILGVEVLLAARGGGRVRYDWLGMFLCFVLTVFALGLYGVSYWMLEGPGIPAFDGSWMGGGDDLKITYHYFNKCETHYMEMEKGDVLEIKSANVSGWLDVALYALDEGEEIFFDSLLDSGSRTVDIPADGEYLLEITGHEANGYARFARIPAEKPDAPENAENPDSPELPDGPETPAA